MKRTYKFFWIILIALIPLLPSSGWNFSIGIIKEIWPENKKITCCYSYGENYEEKFEMTQHLADIAGLILEDD